MVSRGSISEQTIRDTSGNFIKITTLHVRESDANDKLIFARDYILGDSKESTGKSGLVFDASYLDSKNKQHKVIIKAINIAQFNKNEPTILSRYYKAQLACEVNGMVYLVQEYVPGKPLLTDEETILHPELEILDLPARINLIFQLVAQCNLIHHETPSTGAAVIHCDVKGGNVLVDIIDHLVENAYLIDFGLSLELESDDSKQLVKHPQGVYGEPVYFPQETLKGMFGIKTDVYMLVSVIVLLLGENDPYRLKCQLLATINKEKVGDLTPEELLAMVQQPYPLDAIMDFPDVVPAVDLRAITLRFLNRMQANDYEKRPNSDEVLRFFTSLNILMKTHTMTPKDMSAKNQYTAQMFLLAEGLWDSLAGTVPIDIFSKTGEKISVETIKKTYNHIDFAHRPDWCRKIIALGRRGLLGLIAAADAKDWDTVTDMLIATKEHNPDPIIVNLVNLNRELIVTAYIEKIRKLNPTQQASSIHELLEGKNALGAIIKKPRNKFFFTFSCKKYAGEKVTKSIYRVTREFCRRESIDLALDQAPSSDQNSLKLPVI